MSAPRYTVVLPGPGSSLRKFAADDSDAVVEVFREHEPDGRRGWVVDREGGRHRHLIDFRHEGAFNRYTVHKPTAGGGVRLYVDDLAEAADALRAVGVRVWDNRTARWLGQRELEAVG